MSDFKQINNSHYEARHDNGVKLGDLLMEVDGFFVFYPENGGGFWEAYVLREISDKLNALNESWQKQIDSDPAINGGRMKLEGASAAITYGLAE